MNNLDILAQNAEIEFNAFKAEELKNTKEQIFEDYYKIRFFIELSEYLTSDDAELFFEDESEDEMKKLLAHQDHVIRDLYDFFLDCEYGSIENWDGIEDLIRSFCEREESK